MTQWRRRRRLVQSRQFPQRESLKPEYVPNRVRNVRPVSHVVSLPRQSLPGKMGMG